MADKTGQLSSKAKQAIGDFQRYVVDQYRSNAPRWPLAQTLIQRAADSLRDECQRNEAPLDLTMVATKLGVEIIPSTGTGGERGFLRPFGTGLQLFVAERVPHVHRFTTAHELGHALFFVQAQGMYERIFPYGRTTNSENLRREEGLCHAFARALLVPHQTVEGLCNADISLVGADRRARALNISLDVLLRRLLYDAHGWPTAVFFPVWESGHQVKVLRPLRGVRRRRSTDPAPSGECLQRFLGERLYMSWEGEVRSTFTVREWYSQSSSRIWIHM